MWKFLIIICAFTVIWPFAASELFGDERIKDSLDVEKSHASCNTTLKLKSGSFYPPVSETNKTTGFYCYWEIALKNETTDSVCLFFNYLFLDSNDEANVYETVEDAGNETNSILPKAIKAQNGSVTVITGKNVTVVTLKGNSPSYLRNFEVFYSYECSSPVPPDVEILHSPVYTSDIETERECQFRFNEIQHARKIPVFTFKEYDMGNSTVNIENSQPAFGEYGTGHPSDFFMEKDKPLNLKVKQKINSTDHFVLKIHDVDKSCSFYKEIDDANPVILKSPPEELNNGTIVTECRWLVKHKNPSTVLGLSLDTLDFCSVFDIAAVNDGLSELSPPLLQVTTSNKNRSRSQMVRSENPYMWVSFKPLTYASHFVANVTVHGQGGHLINNGTFEMHSTSGDDTAFLLEVEDGKLVQLTFEKLSIEHPATVSVYDGFDTSNLLTTLHEPAKFPIYSKSSKMMVVGKKFSTLSNSFTANFVGVTPGCNHMNSLSTENYILSEKCNSSCSWVIPPEDTNSALIIYMQYISLKEGDQVDIRLLDKNSTRLGLVTADTKHMPHLSIPTNIGAIIKVNQTACKTNATGKVVLIGHSSLLPDCNHDILLKSSEKMQISSPLYPDTYPLFSKCNWTLTLPKESFVHMAFQSLALAENDCVRIYENFTVKHEYVGKVLPDDIFINGNAVVEFDSSKCDKKQVGQSLKADAGFLLNVTVADCGAVFDGKTSGEFSTSISGSKSTCIWKVDVTAKDNVNIISYTVSKKDKLQNYELTVYDGSSVRDFQITNNTNADIWSRSSVLIFVYKRLNVSASSSVLDVKFNTITCNSSMLCDNRLCMHPDWRCDGKNDCGDYSDEKHCGAVPIPPELKYSGYSATAFWMCIFAMLIIGTIVGLGIPVCYQKYKDSRYTQFRELNGIDS